VFSGNGSKIGVHSWHPRWFSRMNTVQRIAKNTFVLGFSQIVSRLLTFLYMMYTARYLGAQGFGILSFAVAFTSIFGALADLGLGPLAIQQVAREKTLAGKYLANINGMKLVLVAITFGLIVILVNLLGYPRETVQVVYLIGLSLVLSAFTGTMNALFQALEKMEYLSLGEILRSCVMFGGVVFGVKHAFDVTGFAAVYLVTAIVVLIYSLIALKWESDELVIRGTTKYLEMDWSFWKSTILKALPFGLSGIFITVYYYVDSVMLSLMVPDPDTVIGWYNAAYRVVLTLISIPSLYVWAIFPVMSRYYKSSANKLLRLFERSIKYMLVFSVPIAVATTLLADRLILLVFGSDYEASVIALQILIWSFVFASVGGVVGYLLNSTDRQLTLTTVVGCGMILNVLLNLVLIPRFSYVGAGVATDVTRLFVIVTELIILWRIGFRLGKRSVVSSLVKPVVASMIMGVFIVFGEAINLFWLTSASAVVYFGVLYVLGGLDAEDIALAKKLASREG